MVGRNRRDMSALRLVNKPFRTFLVPLSYDYEDSDAPSDDPRF